MRTLLGLVSTLIAAAVMSLLLYDRVALLSADRTPPSVQVERVLARWAAENASPDSRILSLVLSDAEACGDPLSVPEPPPERPGLLARLKERLLGPLGGSRHSGEKAFTLVMGGIPDLVDWSYRGRSRSREAADAAELGRLLAKASGAKGRIFIVAHGYTAALALRAAAAEPTLRVERLTAAGISVETLLGSESGIAACPPNLGECVYVRGEGGPGSAKVLTQRLLGGETSPREQSRDLPFLGFEAGVLAVRAAANRPAPDAETAPPPVERPSPASIATPPKAAAQKGFAAKGGSMFILKERGVSAPAEIVRTGSEPSPAGRVALGESGWSVVPPAGWQQLWSGRPTPGRISSVFWTRPKAVVRAGPGESRIWLDFGLMQDDPGLTRACADMNVRPVRAEHLGYPVEICSKETAHEDGGRSFGVSYFTLFNTGFAIRVRYDFPTGERERDQAVFEGICDSLLKR